MRLLQEQNAVLSIKSDAIAKKDVFIRLGLNQRL